MEQDYQIEALIKEILKMLENGVSFKNIKDTFVSDVPEYYIYNSYCAIMCSESCWSITFIQMYSTIHSWRMTNR